jgi:hypothetical protein
MQIRPVRVELFYMERRQADMTKVIHVVDFRNFAKSSKNINLKLFSKYFEKVSSHP